MADDAQSENGTGLAVQAATTSLSRQVDLEDLIRASRAPATWRAYETACEAFEAWCRKHGHRALPASQEALQGYIAHLVHCGRAYATINLHVAGIASAHSAAGLPFDRICIKPVLKGVRRTIGKNQRQAQPLVAVDLKAIIEGQPPTARGLRNTVLFSLGFAAALRQSELSGLDWMKRGAGTGFVEPVELGLRIVLEQSKTGVGEPQTIVVPSADMPTACKALEGWVLEAGVQPGEPILREVNKGGEIGCSRLSDRSIARTIKVEVYRRAIVIGHTEEKARELANACSGHSLRAGFCTAAAMSGVPEWKIRRRSRHKTAEMVARYVRAAEDWKDSGLKGVGF